MKTNKLDVCLISESHTTARSRICIRGYCVYFTSHPDGGAHAGTAIVIRDNIKHCLLRPYETNYVQATTIQINDQIGPLNLSAVYCPPRHIVKENLFTQFFKGLGKRFIAGGDWNAKHSYWGSRLITPRGRELKNSVEANHLLTMSTGEPTYWPTDINKTPDLLDFFITKGICQQNTHIETSLDGSSDHTPVLLTVGSTALFRDTQSSYLTNVKTDWNCFRKHLEDNIILKLPLKTAEDVENASLYITNLIQVAAWISTPILKESHGNTLIPLELREKISEKRRLRRVWQLSRNSEDKKLLNKAIKDLKNLLHVTANDSVKQRLEKMSPNAHGIHSLWQATKNLPQPQQCSPPIRNGNTWARTDAEKAETFANYLTEVFKPNEAVNPEDPEIDRVLNQDLQLSLPIKPTSPRELLKEIADLDSKKAPGFDMITPKVIKELPRKCIVFLTSLFNAIFRTSHVPTIWKISEVVMIHKPGKPVNDASSHRPISLTPILSKLWEKITLTRLRPFIDSDQVIPDHQFGFRRKHSTIEQVHRVYHTVRHCLEKKEYCSAVFLDIQQAFDRVWHKGLLYKIKKSIPHTFYPLLASYLSERMFRVKYGDARSALHSCYAGVPQGSVLGPTLYNIFTSDLPQLPNVTVATYADDAAFLACNTNPEEATNLLQVQLDYTNEWLNKWRIKASVPKSHHITFTLRRGNCSAPKLDQTKLAQKYIATDSIRSANVKNLEDLSPVAHWNDGTYHILAAPRGFTPVAPPLLVVA
ncbi:unnamed protein product [Colias eurytheme]|nr:unnamed protein product [Colias eurytheme]